MEDTIKYRGHKITIWQDEDPWSPRGEQDNLGIMMFFHTRYSLGDDVGEQFGVSRTDFKNWDEVEKYIKRKLKGVLITPVYMYDHSGITISTEYTYPYNDRWDAGQIGFIFTTNEKIRERYLKKAISSKTFKRAEQALLFEIKEYDLYLRGEVYGYTVEKGDETIASCGGYFGDEYVLIDAKGEVDANIDGPKLNKSWVKQQQAKKQTRDSKGRFIKQ